MAKEVKIIRRKISLGLKRPKKLDEDTIYVDFEQSSAPPHQIVAIAYSKEEFTHHTCTIDGTGISSVRARASSWDLPYEDFIKDLVNSNDGLVDYRRIIEDGSGLVSKVLGARKLLDIGPIE